MISEANITARSLTAPWAESGQVEQDLTISRLSNFSITVCREPIRDLEAVRFSARLSSRNPCAIRRRSVSFAHRRDQSALSLLPY